MKFDPINLIQVKLNVSDSPVAVGRLARSGRQIYFEYDPSFIEKNLQISPFKLPVKSGVLEGPDIFDGLFGVFNDSLPDGWGRLLLDRAVNARGIPHQKLGALDRLAHVGSLGMGALIYEPEIHDFATSEHHLSLDKLDTEVKKLLVGDSEDVIEKLLELGGSSAGARPKVLVGYQRKEEKLISGQQDLPDGYEPWLIKFPSSSDQPEIGRIEYAYSLMAKAAGLEMPETHLFRGELNRAWFGIKRFDRIGNRRIHVHTVSGLLHADHRIPGLDYESILRCSLALNRDMRDADKIFRLAAFNVFSHNRDDHSKNFSFLMNQKGAWAFAPVYDLTFSYGPGGEHSTTIFGEGRNPGTRQLLDLGKKFQISNAETIIEEVIGSVSRWKEFAEEAGVTRISTDLINKELLAIK